MCTYVSVRRSTCTVQSEHVMYISMMQFAEAATFNFEDIHLPESVYEKYNDQTMYFNF